MFKWLFSTLESLLSQIERYIFNELATANSFSVNNFKTSDNFVKFATDNESEETPKKKASKKATNKKDADSDKIDRLEAQLEQTTQLMTFMKEELLKVSKTVTEVVKSPEQRKLEAIKTAKQFEIQEQIQKLQDELKLVETATIDTIDIIDRGYSPTQEKPQPVEKLNPWDRRNFTSGQEVFDPYATQTLDVHGGNSEDYVQATSEMRALTDGALDQEKLANRFNQDPSSKLQTTFEVKSAHRFDERNALKRYKVDDTTEMDYESNPFFNGIYDGESIYTRDEQRASLDDREEMFLEAQRLQSESETGLSSVKFESINPNQVIIRDKKPEVKGSPTMSEHSENKGEFNEEMFKVNSFEEGLQTPERVSAKKMREVHDAELEDVSSLPLDQQLKLISKQKIIRSEPIQEDTLESLIGKLKGGPTASYDEFDDASDDDWSIGDPDEVFVPLTKEGKIDYARTKLSVEEIETKPVGKNTKKFVNDSLIAFQNQSIEEIDDIETVPSENLVEKLGIKDETLSSINTKHAATSKEIGEVISKEEMLAEIYGEDDLENEATKELERIEEPGLKKPRISLTREMSNHRTNVSKLPRKQKKLTAEQVVELINKGAKSTVSESFNDDEFRKLEQSLPGDNSKSQKRKNQQLNARPETVNKKPVRNSEATSEIRVGKKLSTTNSKKPRTSKTTKIINKDVASNQTVKQINKSKEYISAVTSEFQQMNGFTFSKPKRTEQDLSNLTTEQKIQTKLKSKTQVDAPTEIEATTTLRIGNNFGLPLNKVELNPFFRTSDGKSKKASKKSNKK